MLRNHQFVGKTKYFLNTIILYITLNSKKKYFSSLFSKTNQDRQTFSSMSNFFTWKWRLRCSKREWADWGGRGEGRARERRRPRPEREKRGRKERRIYQHRKSSACHLDWPRKQQFQLLVNNDKPCYPNFWYQSLEVIEVLKIWSDIFWGSHYYIFI